jgi:hypothetical protein
VAIEGQAKRRLRDFEVLTLDCYGTLVDRDTGIVNALMPSLHDAGVTAGRGEILRAFHQAERAKLLTTPGVCYAELLLEVHARLAATTRQRKPLQVRSRIGLFIAMSQALLTI